MRLALTALSLLAPLTPLFPQQPTLALVGGRVIDGYGGAPIEDGVVLIAGERIVAVGTRAAVQVPAGVETISTDGMTVMPGLFDMHVHLMLLGHGAYARWDSLYGSREGELIMPIAALQLLRAGVTSARDLGAEPEDIFGVRRRIEADEIPGPRLFVAGAFIQEPPTSLTKHGSAGGCAARKTRAARCSSCSMAARTSSS